MQTYILFFYEVYVEYVVCVGKGCWFILKQIDKIFFEVWMTIV